MPPKTQTPPPQPAPPSALSSAQPISPAELQRELAPKPPMMRNIGGGTITAPPEVKEVPKEPEDRPPGAPPRPDFKTGLRKGTLEKKPEPAPEEKKPEPVKPEPKKEPEPIKTEAADEIPEDQRKVLPHDKPDTAKRIKFFIAEKDKAAKEAAALRTEIETLKKAPPTAANTEEIEKLRTELTTKTDEAMKYRRRYEVETDPEFATKFQQPVKAAETTINDTLKRGGFTEATLKTIADEGGFAAFSRSRRVFPIAVPDLDNPGKTKTEYHSASDIAHSWLQSLPIADASTVRELIGQQERLKMEEKSAVQKAQDEAKGYFENQTKSQREQAETAKATHEKTVKEYSEWLKKAETETEFLKDRTAPDGADEATQKSVTEHNEFNKQLRDRLRKDPTNAAEYGALKLEAAESHHLRRELGARDARIATLEEQLKKSKAAMKTTPTGGSLLSPKAPSDQKKDKNADPTDFRTSLRKKMLAASGNADDEA